MYILAFFPVAVVTYSDKIHLKEKGIILVHSLLYPVRGDLKGPPGRPTHLNAKARFIVCTIQAGRHLISAAARGGTPPF